MIQRMVPPYGTPVGEDSILPLELARPLRQMSRRPRPDVTKVTPASIDLQFDRSERASVEAQRFPGRGEARSDQAPGDHDVAAPQSEPAAREVVGKPGERFERVAHDVAAAPLADLLAVGEHRRAQRGEV